MKFECPDVRIAVPEDRPAILDLCRGLHAENALFSLKMEAVETVVDRSFDKDRGMAVIGVTGKVGDIHGCVCVVIESQWYTDDYCVSELFNYVSPDYRSSNYSSQQILFAKNISESMKLPLLIGVLSTERTEAKVRLYGRLLDNIGAFFMYRPESIEANVLFSDKWVAPPKRAGRAERGRRKTMGG